MKKNSQPLIQFNNVTLEYRIYKDKTDNLKEHLINWITRRHKHGAGVDTYKALDRVNLEIFEGERVGIIGMNGAGKSTTLKVMSGILRPTGGNVIVNGAVQPLIEIGAGFSPEFSGRENIFLNGYMLGFTRSEIREKVDEVIEFAELGEFIDVPVKYYSSGMIIRLAFTIATSIRPEILLIDEMLSAGDAYFIAKAKKRMESLMSKAKALVMVSHNLSSISEDYRRTIVLDKGAVVFDGPTERALNLYNELIEKKTEDASKNVEAGS